MKGNPQIVKEGFFSNWKNMQDVYSRLLKHMEEEGIDKHDPSFVHPSWKDASGVIMNILVGPPDRKVLEHPTIRGMMVRQGFTISQEYEVTYLQYCLRQDTRDSICSFKDSSFGNLEKECKEFHCSTNTLGHLFYAARINELFGPCRLNVIVEFGGGYGNLAMIHKHMHPGSTIIVLDLPEMLALQYLFLTSTFDESKVVVHERQPTTIRLGAINLVPVFHIGTIQQNADLFISTFALSETPLSMQSMISRRRFFGAQHAYITGQLPGASDEHKWAEHTRLFEEIRRRYPNVQCLPFHVFQKGVKLYEVAASSGARHEEATPRSSAALGPLVTIYIPAYNAAQYLDATLESLLRQTYQNYEIVIVNDGSTDGTLAIAERFASTDKRIRVVSHAKNKGLSAARNTGWKNASATSRYVLNHDSDDISLPGKLEALVEYLENNPEVDAVGCYAEYFNDNNEALGRPPIEWQPSKIRETFGTVNSMIVSATLVRREMYEDIAPFRSEYGGCDDYDFWSRALIKGYTLANVPSVLHKIRLHKNSMGATQRDEMEGIAGKIRRHYHSVMHAAGDAGLHIAATDAARPKRTGSSHQFDILHTVEFYAPHVGGAELVVQKISEQLVRRGHRVTVATQRLPERQGRELNGVRIEEFDVSGKFATGVRGEAARYQQFLRDFSGDVMMNYAAQQWATDLAFDVVAAGTPRRANIIAPCGYSALLDPQTLRWPEFGDYFRATLPAVLPRYDAAVYHSALYKDFTYGEQLGLKNGVVIPNGCEAAEFLQPPTVDFRTKFNLGKRKLALCVANFYPGKGHQRVIECLRAMNRPDTTLVLVGKHGEELPRLRELARGLDVRFLVDVSRADTVAAFHAADLFLFGSEIEASPLVIIEAKASHTPFVSTDCGNVREWKGGVVCTPDEMAAHANRLLDDKTERDRLAAEGWQEWKERLTWDAVADQWEDLYLRLHHAKCGVSAAVSVPQPAVKASPAARPAAKPVHKQGLVVVKLQGGMGNQMFEYAAGLALARRRNARLVLDLSFLRDRTPRPNFTHRDYDLDIFKLAPDCEVENDASTLQDNLRVFRQKHFHYDPDFASLPADVYLDGYWQSPRYFAGIEAELRESFQFAQPLTSAQAALREQISRSIAVCLNVRRADFVANPEAAAFHGSCDDAYFRAASALVARCLPQGRFFIFSDDPAWCASVNLTDGRESLSVGHEHKGDRFAAYLQLMSACHHFILPNSSFGWWAAFLSATTDKMVVVPEPWLNDVETNMNDMLPPTWHRLSKSWN